MIELTEIPSNNHFKVVLKNYQFTELKNILLNLNKEAIKAEIMGELYAKFYFKIEEIITEKMAANNRGFFENWAEQQDKDFFKDMAEIKEFLFKSVGMFRKDKPNRTNDVNSVLYPPDVHTNSLDNEAITKLRIANSSGNNQELEPENK